MTYTLSTERTTTKLFIVGYEKTMNRELTEIPLQELISRGNIRSVLSYLCIKVAPEVVGLMMVQITLDMFRESPSDSALHEIAESVEQQEANSKYKMQKGTKKVSTPKQKKQAIKLVDTNSNNRSSTNKGRKNNKRT